MQRHLWNTDFEWLDHTGPFGALNREQVRHYDQHGYIVVPRLLDPPATAELRKEADRLEAESDAFLRQVKDGRFSIAESGAITFSPHLVARSRQLRALSVHSAIVSICVDLLGPDVSLYWDQRCIRSRRNPGVSRGTRTTATPTSNRSSTSRAGWPSPTRQWITVAHGLRLACTGWAPWPTTSLNPSVMSASPSHPKGSARSRPRSPREGPSFSRR